MFGDNIHYALKTGIFGQRPVCSLIHLMRAIARAYGSTLATSLMLVKNSTRHFCL